MPSASKGTEREIFVEIFLRNVLPPAYRFGTGVITDTVGKQSGQIDVVVEHAIVPSFPLVGASIPRLYLAEGVGAAVEVKSDLPGQWEEVLATGKSVGALHRDNGTSQVPYFAVGYAGWKKKETMFAKFQEARAAGVPLTGLLSLAPAFYIGWLAQQVPQPPTIVMGHQIPAISKETAVPFIVEGAAALWGILFGMQNTVTSLIGANRVLLPYGPEFKSQPEGFKKAKKRR